MRNLLLIVIICAFVQTMFGQNYVYTYTPEIQVFNSCHTGTVVLPKIIYTDGSVCDTAMTVYGRGMVHVALWSRESTTGTLLFKIQKCSGFFQNGSAGKIFVIDRVGNISYTFPYYITNETTDNVMCQVPDYGDFEGLRSFDIVMVSLQGDCWSAGSIDIRGTIVAGPPIVTTTVATIDEGNWLWMTGLVQPNGADTHWSFEYGSNLSTNHRSGVVYASDNMEKVFSYAQRYNQIIPSCYRVVAYNSYGTSYGEWMCFNENEASSVGCYCDNNTVLTDCTGSFSDGSAQNQYKSNSDCKWLIQPNNSSRIALSFTEFDVDNSDVVNIYDGSNVNANLLASYRGNTLPPMVVSTGNTMLVHFITDASHNACGWTASYACISGGHSCQFADCNANNCGGNSEFSDALVYDAITYLCNHDIVEGPGGNLVNPSGFITRAELAKISLYGLYQGKENVPVSLVTDYFPSVYADLQNPQTFYYRAAKALLYLDYGDGISPFDRDRASFNPEGYIARKYVLKVLLETFNLAPESLGSSNPFSDFSPNEACWGYAKKAYSLGLLSSTQFRPDDSCTRSEAFVWLYRMLTSSNLTIPVPLNDYSNMSSFFIPANINHSSISDNPGLQQGNFSYYEKSGFNIPGYISLNFAVSYNSYLTELPADFFPIQPLGMAWTHSYNFYMNVIRDEYMNRNYYAFHIQDGQIIIYTDSNNTYHSVTQGNYNALHHTSTDDFILKTKDQYEYKFSRLLDNPNIYYLTSIIDRHGHTVTMTYENGVAGNKRIHTVTTLNRSLVFSYHNGSDLLSGVTDPMGRSIHFNYSDGLLTQYQDAKGQTTNYQYSSLSKERGLITHITLPRGNTIDNSYFQRKLVNTHNSNTGETTISQQLNYSSVTGNYFKSTVQTNLNGGGSVSANFTYGKDGTLTAVSNADELDIVMEYTDSFNPTQPTILYNKKTGLKTYLTYDRRGNVTQRIIAGFKRDASGNISDYEVLCEKYTYDSLNNVTSHVNFEGNTMRLYYRNGDLCRIEDEMGNTTTIVNNNDGVPVRVTDVSGLVALVEYDAYGMKTRVSIPELSLSAENQYDALSRVISNMNINNQTTTYSYDANDNLVSKTDPMGYVTGYQYDANDNISSIINAHGIQTMFTYDANDLLASLVFQGTMVSYTYNNDGSVHSKTDANGIVSNYSYNSSGNVLDNGYASFVYDLDGQLTSIIKDNQSIIFTYDIMRRVKDVTYDGVTIQYEYDRMGNITKMIYPNNKIVTYTYDKLNRMTSLKNWYDYTEEYHYDAGGNIDYTRLYQSGWNGTPIIRTDYTYDRAGRCISQISRMEGGQGDTLVAYIDSVNNLGMILGQTVKEPYSAYEAFVEDSVAYVYNEANRLLSAGNIVYTYDNNGNMLSKTGRTMTYDRANRLLSVSGDYNATYTYDGMGNRRSRIHNGQEIKYVWDVLNGNVLMETDANGNVVNYYVYGIGGLSFQQNANGETNMYVCDYRGNVVMGVGTGYGNPIKYKYQYDEFGNILQMQCEGTNPFCFMGRYGCVTDTTDLVYVRARYYDPTIGRFLSEDPVWSTNLYPYADNNPINMVDPSGLISQTFSRQALREASEAVSTIGGKLFKKAVNYISEQLFQVFSMKNPSPKQSGTQTRNAQHQDAQRGSKTKNTRIEQVKKNTQRMLCSLFPNSGTCDPPSSSSPPSESEIAWNRTNQNAEWQWLKNHELMKEFAWQNLDLPSKILYSSVGAGLLVVGVAVIAATAPVTVTSYLYIGGYTAMGYAPAYISVLSR